MNKRELQRIERKQEILDCGLDILISKGYEGMKIRDIADKLNISVGLFFNYFDSKESLYEELIHIGLSGPQNVLQLSAGETDSLAFFTKMTETIFEAVKSSSFTGKMFILMSQINRSSAVPDNIKKLVSDLDVYTPVIPLILKGQNEGTIKPGNSKSLAMAYWSAIQGICEMYDYFTNIPFPESSWIVDILRK